MFFNIVKNDFIRNKVTTIVTFIFMTLAVILAASAMNNIANLTQSLAEFKEKAQPSHLTQMHVGEFSQTDIDDFTEANKKHIALQETSIMRTIDGSMIHLENKQTLAGTVQDISFTVQNKNFDFLLDLNNEKLSVDKGSVAVPIYFMKEYDLNVGETIRLSNGNIEKSFIISDYVRDYAMNSSLTSSKRFVIHEEDFKDMWQAELGEAEYLIQFTLTEEGDSGKLQTAYIDAGLPANGPMVPGQLFTIFNALSDMTIVLIIIFISILLIVIAALCIRLTFLATIEEDLREIGVMKSIGISKAHIKKVYLTKYRVLAIAAGVVGFILSFPVVHLFNGNMRLYISSDLSSSLKYILSLIAPIFVYALIMLFCQRIFKSVDKVSAVEALRGTSFGKNKKGKKYRLSLLNNRFFPTNIFMGIRDIWDRFSLYRILFTVFIVSSFIIILPLNMNNTLKSPDFLTYMGIGQSDLRIDIHQSDSLGIDYHEILKKLEDDVEIESFESYVTSAYQIRNEDHAWDYIYIESGDFAAFPLQYLKGKAPAAPKQIALSYANASSNGLNKDIGDEVVIKSSQGEEIYTVTGIYQDITNGGKTAKASHIEGHEDKVMWYVISLNLAEGVDPQEKIEEYRTAYSSIQVNDTKDYTRQTLGNIMDQMSNIVVVASVIALGISALITALFLRMLLSKDRSQIAIMRSLGLTIKQITGQYMAGMMLVLLVGIFFGVMLSQILGEGLMSLGLSFMGAAKIEFTIIYWQVWLLAPLAFILVVGLTIILGSKVLADKDLSVTLKD